VTAGGQNTVGETCQKLVRRAECFICRSPHSVPHVACWQHVRQWEADGRPYNDSTRHADEFLHGSKSDFFPPRHHSYGCPGWHDPPSTMPRINYEFETVWNDSSNNAGAGWRGCQPDIRDSAYQRFALPPKTRATVGRPPRHSRYFLQRGRFLTRHPRVSQFPRARQRGYYLIGGLARSARNGRDRGRPEPVMRRTFGFLTPNLSARSLGQFACIGRDHHHIRKRKRQ